MFTRRDRRDLAHLALWVAAYGLVLAPALHTLLAHGAQVAVAEANTLGSPSGFAPHDDSKPHSHHPSGTPHTHHAYDPSHLGASFLEASPPGVELAPVDGLCWTLEGSERPQAGRAVPHPAMPQGP